MNDPLLVWIKVPIRKNGILRSGIVKSRVLWSWSLEFQKYLGALCLKKEPLPRNFFFFYKKIKKRFVKSNKVETSTILSNLISIKYKGKRNIRQYIMKMSHFASKLKALKLELSDNLLVHLVLISLLAQFS